MKTRYRIETNLFYAKKKRYIKNNYIFCMEKIRNDFTTPYTDKGNIKKKNHFDLSA